MLGKSGGAGRVNECVSVCVGKEASDTSKGAKHKQNNHMQMGGAETRDMHDFCVVIFSPSF